MSLIASDLTVRLGRSNILHEVNVTAQTGQLTAIIGPNGSGKTTLLRALTGEIAPVSGQITLNGDDISALPPHLLAARRAVLPQQTSLAFPFTATEIIRIGLTSHSVRDDGLIHRALASVGLPSHAGRLYQEMSGGEQQRVQLARALAQVWQPVTQDGPNWLLLDEPVSSLDIAHQLTVMRLARDYARRGGGVVAVMHDLNLTAMFADQLFLMQQGRVIGEGTPGQVLTDDLLTRAYGCGLVVNQTPDSGPWILPQVATG